jgi:hypothetical protein
MAGLSSIRPQPSAAPVHTPSKRPKNVLIPGTESKALNMGISVVPALAKHTSIPASTAVLTNISAPFMEASLLQNPVIANHDAWLVIY